MIKIRAYTRHYCPCSNGETYETVVFYKREGDADFIMASDPEMDLRTWCLVLLATAVRSAQEADDWHSEWTSEAYDKMLDAYDEGRLEAALEHASVVISELLHLPGDIRVWSAENERIRNTRNCTLNNAKYMKLILLSTISMLALSCCPLKHAEPQPVQSEQLEYAQDLSVFSLAMEMKHEPSVRELGDKFPKSAYAKRIRATYSSLSLSSPSNDELNGLYQRALKVRFLNE